MPFFGGHVLTLESYEKAAIREVFEETGLKASEKDLKFLAQTKKEGQGKLGVINRRFTNYYFCHTNKKINEFNFSPNEVPLAFFKNFEDIKSFILSEEAYKASLKEEAMLEIFDKVYKELIN